VIAIKVNAVQCSGEAGFESNELVKSESGYHDFQAERYSRPNTARILVTQVFTWPYPLAFLCHQILFSSATLTWPSWSLCSASEDWYGLDASLCNLLALRFGTKSLLWRDPL